MLIAHSPNRAQVSNDFSIELLQQFVISTPTETQIVNTSFMPRDLAPQRKAQLVAYHPKAGGNYKLTAPIVTTAAGSFLRIEPVEGAWNDDQKELLRQLKFIPVPEAPVPNRKPVLMMMRSGTGNIRLANTHWYLVNAKIEKTEIKGKLLNDVILTWEYRAPPSEEAYLVPVISCWKW